MPDPRDIKTYRSYTGILGYRCEVVEAAAVQQIIIRAFRGIEQKIGESGAELFISLVCMEFHYVLLRLAAALLRRQQPNSTGA